MPNLLKKITQAKKVEEQVKIPKKDSFEDEFFISIILSDQELQSALVSKNQKIKEYSKIKTYFNRQDLLTQLDQSLQELGPAADEVADCVFIFDESWLENGDLLDNKKVIVQEVAENLSLGALGQLSITEGIHHSRIINDPKDSSLIIYLRETDFDLILIKHGQLLVNIRIGRSVELSNDLQEGLARISQELGEQGKYFPNKVFLTSLNYDQKILNKEQSVLQAFDWNEVTGFLQSPEFVVLESDFLIKALSLAASYMLSNDFTSQLNQNLNSDNSPETKLEPTPKLSDQEQVKREEQKLSSFGVDLSPKEIEIDQADQKLLQDDSSSEEATTSILDKTDDYIDNASSSDKVLKTKTKISRNRFSKKNNRPLSIGIVGGLLFLLTLFFVFTVFLSNITIKIKADERILQKNLEIILDPELTESDFTQNLLKVFLVQKEVSGQDVQNTTGISLVGDKAKGEIDLFNKTFTEKVFAPNTILEYEGVFFVLEEEVTVVAAEEKDGGRGVDYGNEQITIIAKDIGAEANIEKRSKLKVADYSEDTYSATAIDNFVGGSSREVRVVSKDDLNALSSQLKNSLSEIAITEFNQESTGGDYYIPTGNSRVVAFKYDHEEGDEVEVLSLETTLEVEAVKYSSSDLKQLARAVLLLDLPENYDFVDEEPSLLTDQPVPSDDGSTRLILNTELSAKSRAIIKEELLLDLVAGKSLEEAKNNLEKEELIVEAEIIYQPLFLAKLVRRLPQSIARFNFIID